MRRQSKKRAARLLERAECRARVYERAHGLCEACPRLHDGPIRRAVDTHEPLSRARGGDPYDPEQCIAICRPCHTWVHAHPEAATELGLLVHSWEAR